MASKHPEKTGPSIWARNPLKLDRVLPVAGFFFWLLSAQVQMRSGQGAVALGGVVVDSRALLELMVGLSFLALTVVFAKPRDLLESRTAMLLVAAVGSLSGVALVALAGRAFPVPALVAVLFVNAFCTSFLATLSFRRMLSEDASAAIVGLIASLLLARVCLSAVLAAVPSALPLFHALSPMVVAVFLKDGSLRMEGGPSLEPVRKGFHLAPMVLGLVLLGLSFGMTKAFVTSPSRGFPISANLCAALVYAAFLAAALLRPKMRSSASWFYQGAFGFLVVGVISYLGFGAGWERLSFGMLFGSQYLIMALLFVVAPFLPAPFRSDGTLLFGWAFCAFFLSSSAGFLFGTGLHEVLGLGGEAEEAFARAVVAVLGIFAVVFQAVVLPAADAERNARAREAYRKESDEFLVRKCRDFALSAGLSEREREVLEFWARGMTAKEIGDRLFISPGTVRVHVGHIYAKADVHGRSELLDCVQKSPSEQGN